MPQLRRHRPVRNRKGQLRAHKPKKRRRRNLVKFIPEADSDFAFVAERVFLSYIKRDPDAYDVTVEDVAEIEQAVTVFRVALHNANPRFSRSSRAVMEKDEARKEAERIVRLYGNIIRANPNVTDTNKKLLRLKVRPKRLGKRTCPSKPPHLEFVGSGDGQAGGIGLGNGSGVHVLQYYDGYINDINTRTADLNAMRKVKPDGAARLELYFDMIPAGDPNGVPRHPAARGWPKYLRSFTRTPMEVEFPIPSQPMLIVYWAKWADSTGGTSGWSKPCVARVEGWAAGVAPGMQLPEGSSAQPHVKWQGRDVEISQVTGAPLPAAEKALSMSMQYLQMYTQQMLPSRDDHEEGDGEHRLLNAA